MMLLATNHGAYRAWGIRLLSLRTGTSLLCSLSRPLQTATEECRSLRGQLEERGQRLQAAQEAVGKLEVGPGRGRAGSPDQRLARLVMSGPSVWACQGEAVCFGFHCAIEGLPTGLPVPKPRLSSVHFCGHPEFVSQSHSTPRTPGPKLPSVFFTQHCGKETRRP